MTVLTALMSSPLTADKVLRAFRHSEPYLFLGAACTTVAVIAAGICILRRRFDALLIYLAMFAFLYGQRLWLKSEVLRISIGPSELFSRIRVAIDYLVPVPGFLFFQAAGFLGSEKKKLGLLFCVIFSTLVVLTLVFGPHDAYDLVDTITVTAALSIVLYRSLRPATRRTGSTGEERAVRIGLAFFVAAALWDNLAGFRWKPFHIEPYAFAVFLMALGYVAAKRALDRDRELGEVRSELETARRMQLSILPDEFPESLHFRVGARYVPMSSVAGDFYDFLRVEPERAGILIADVSGHGVSAALIASMVKMAASSQSGHASEPAHLLAGMNAALCGNTQGQFVTAAYVHLDAEAGQLRYAAAGHPAMLLVRAGTVTEVVENGLILGVTKDTAYAQARIELRPGDRLVLYTDGVLEARDAAGTLFGEERLHRLALQTAVETPRRTADRIVDAVRGWSREQDDDLTVIVCDYQTPA